LTAAFNFASFFSSSEFIASIDFLAQGFSATISSIAYI